MAHIKAAFTLIIEDINERKKLENYTGSIINCSWWVGRKSPVSKILKESFKRLYELGAYIVTTSGNNPQGGDKTWLSVQKTYSAGIPACLKYAIKVGAIDENDSMATFSFAHDLITCFAPGVKIQSLSSQGSELVLSGTSLASPHVSGLVAYFLSIIPDPKEFSSFQMIHLIKMLSTKNLLKGPDFLAEEFRSKIGHNVFTSGELKLESQKMINAVYNSIIHNGILKSKEDLRHIMLTANDYSDADGLVYLSE